MAGATLFPGKHIALNLLHSTVPTKDCTWQLTDAGDGLDGTEEAVSLDRVQNVRLQQQAIHLAVHILDGGLECVERTGLRDLHLCTGKAKGDRGMGRSEKWAGQELYGDHKERPALW